MSFGGQEFTILLIGIVLAVALYHIYVAGNKFKTPIHYPTLFIIGVTVSIVLDKTNKETNGGTVDFFHQIKLWVITLVVYRLFVGDLVLAWNVFILQIFVFMTVTIFIEYVMRRYSANNTLDTNAISMTIFALIILSLAVWIYHASKSWFKSPEMQSWMSLKNI
jgi:hypothetical protein